MLSVPKYCTFEIFDPSHQKIEKIDPTRPNPTQPVSELQLYSILHSYACHTCERVYKTLKLPFSNKPCRTATCFHLMRHVLKLANFNFKQLMKRFAIKLTHVCQYTFSQKRSKRFKALKFLVCVTYHSSNNEVLITTSKSGASTVGLYLKTESDTIFYKYITFTGL